MYLVIGIFVGLSIILGALFYYSNLTLSATRAYINGEGHWSKAQKEATIQLYDYLIFENPNSYKRFRELLTINRGDKLARQSLTSESTDYEKVRQGFLMGNNHPENIDELIWLFENFESFPPMKEAIQIWKNADQKIGELRELGQQIHGAIQADSLSDQTRRAFYKRLYHLDQQLTEKENAFSAKIGSTARQISQLVFWIAMAIGGILILLAAYSIYKVIDEIHDLNDKLRKSRTKLQHVLKNSRDIIYEQNLKSGEYEYVSSAVENLLGYPPEEIRDKGPNFVYEQVHPEDRNRVKQKIRKIKEGDTANGQLENAEYRIQKRDGDYVWINNQRTVILDKNNQPALIVGNVRDISSHKHKEDQLSESLEQQRLLLAEMHHRVKNNLSLISGILRLQAQIKDDLELQKIFEECQNRIDSIAEVHELLYENESFSEVDLDQYLSKLMDRIIQNVSGDLRVNHHLSIDASPMQLSEAVHFGLLINELTTNSIKHAFPDRSEGNLYLTIREEGYHLQIAYSDDGIGLGDSKSFKEDHQQSMGTKLITTLLSQLDAQYQFSSAEPGFKLEITMQHSTNGTNMD